jgi:hypothetical protein
LAELRSERSREGAECSTSGSASRSRSAPSSWRTWPRRAPRSALVASSALALLASPAWSLGVGSEGASTPLFSITKSENKNYVQFAEQLDATCAPVGDAPVFAYWRMLEHGPSATEPLLSLEEPAYGVASQSVTARTVGYGAVRVTLRALREAPLVVESRRGASGACEASARTPIAGAPARLFNVHAVLKWPFGVARLLVSGWSLADGHPVRDAR